MGVAGIDMSPVVRQFALPANSVSILRATTPGEYVNGRYEEPVFTEIPIRYACVQAIGGEDRMVLPEAIRTKDVQQFFLIDDIEPLARSAQRPADRLKYNGHEWEIVTEAKWNENANYWDVIAARIGQ